ncbi:MAG: sugar phosphate isomerase/epimerase [Planctomycetota bacterium]|nr:sugar phosphate isomerase/epimerase [Planctomycetota bacterium]
MRLGVHCYLFTERWSDAALPILDRCKALGAGAFEIAVGDDVRFSFKETRARAEALGLSLTLSPGGAWPEGCDASSDNPEMRARGIAWHKRWIDACAETGAVAYTGNMYGRTGDVKKRRPPPDEFRRVVDALRELSEHAQRRGVVLAFEPMSHFRTHLINTPEQAARVLEAVAHPNCRVVLDTYHLATEIRDYGAGIRLLKDKLWCLHACENDRGCPGGGLVPWPEIFAALRATGFDGLLMLETYNSSIGDFAYERAMFHNVCPDGEAYARRGFAFLKSGLGL